MKARSRQTERTLSDGVSANVGQAKPTFMVASVTRSTEAGLKWLDIHLTCIAGPMTEAYVMALKWAFEARVPVYLTLPHPDPVTPKRRKRP